MINKNLLPLLTVLVLFSAACTAGSDPTTSSGESSTTADTTDPVSSGTTIADNGRTIEIVGCADAPEDVAIVCEVYDLIERNYVDDVSDASLAGAAMAGVVDLDGSTSDSVLVCAIPTQAFTSSCESLADEAEDNVEGAEAMIRGMSSVLDPNSVYLDSDSVALIEEEQEGQIEGIGALVTAEDSEIEEGNPQCSVISATCRLIIISTIADSPAEAAGIRSDDVIVGVNGESIDGWTLDEVTATVRGPSGTDVAITVERGGSTFDVTITRAAVVIPVVVSAVYDDIGYIKLNLFSDNADEQLEDALREVLDAGVTELIFDLRDNPGGLLDTAIEVTSLFLADGDVVVTQGPNDDRTFDVSGNLVMPADIEMTTIVNRGSASASEVVSAVLQERGRSLVIGESSFGKNTVQQRFSLSNGGAFKVTIARWVTPGGLDFGDGGVTPDVVREISPELDQEAVARLAASIN